MINFIVIYVILLLILIENYLAEGERILERSRLIEEILQFKYDLYQLRNNR